MDNSQEYLDFKQALNRLHEIVGVVRNRETGLEESIDMLEEAVQLASICTENIDKNQWVRSSEGESHEQGDISRR